jgi:hypothetical protein
MPQEGLEIRAADATIRTTEVSIRCLVIGKKQLTLSTFRQIPSSPILDHEGMPRGPMWGRVNYSWKGCDHGKPGHGRDVEHYHIVWQNSGRLMRDCVRDRDFTKLGYIGGNMDLEQAAFNLLLLKRYAEEPYPEHPEWDNGILIKTQGLEIGFVPADFRDCTHVDTIRLWDWRDGMLLHKRNHETIGNMKINKSRETSKMIAAYRKVAHSKKEADAFNRNAARTKMEIEALEQLYIAV